MSEQMTIITERVDDIPLLLAHLEHMGVAELLDEHFPTHGNWQGLSLGQMTSVWLSYILSEADHRMNQLEPWGSKRLTTLQGCLGLPVKREDLTDDRLAAVLDYLSEDARWDAFEAALNQRTVRVYDLKCQRVRIDATTAKGYMEVTEEGMFPFGPSKDHRPDLPQIKINVAVLDPLGMPLATTGVSGERADDPLYLPAIRRVQQSLGRSGMTYIGDCKMGSLETRAAVAASQDYYLCPLAGVQLPQETLQQVLEPVWQGQQALTNVWRPIEGESPDQSLIAEGFAYRERLSAEVAGQRLEWEERRLVIRSLRHAHAQEQALRTRVTKAIAVITALNQRGRGKKRWTDATDLHAVCQQLMDKYDVAGLIGVHVRTETTDQPVRRYGDRPARVKREPHVTVQAAIDHAALDARIQRLGWRVYATNHAPEDLSLEQAVLAYREQFVIEQPFGRLKHKPLSLTPMYLDSEARVKGLVRVLSLGLRVLTLIEWVARRRLRQDRKSLAGIYAGNPKRATARPTTEMMLQAFKDLTLTVIQHGSQITRHLPPLSAVQQQILELVGLSHDIYMRLTEHFSNPIVK
jgi:transposase